MTNEIIDSAIERALERDRDAMPKFSAQPSERLTAQLAVNVATRGMVKSMGSKLLVLAGGVVLTVVAIYLIPAKHQPLPTRHAATALAPAPAATSIQVSPPGSTVTRAAEAMPEQRTGNPLATRHKEPKLDEGDRDKNIPRKLDEHYEPPIK